MLRRFCSAVLALVFAASMTAAIRAEIRLPRIFTDNMVLQQQMPIAVWGWAAAGETVTVTLAGTSAVAHANEDGAWRVDLAGMPADGTLFPAEANRHESTICAGRDFGLWCAGTNLSISGVNSCTAM